MFEKYIAVIQAGGKGKRMRALSEDKIPKPMVRMNGKPMLQWQIEKLAGYGFGEFVIIIGHLGVVIKDYFGEGIDFGVHIRYIEEKEPLGSAGSLICLKNMCEKDKKTEHFLLIFGDVMFDLDWKRMIAFYEKKKADAVMVAHPNCHPYDSDILILDGDERVIGIDSKNNIREDWYDNIVNAGIYIFSMKFLDKSPFDEKESARKLDLEKDVIMKHIKDGKIYAYRTPEYVKDAGTIERFRQVEKEQSNGGWAKCNLESRQKCIFLDRDGTINKFRGLIFREEELELEEDAAEAIRLINESGYLAIVVTNQPVVARGMCEEKDVYRIHKKLQVLLGNKGAYLNDIIFCPHHQDKGFPEERTEYKIKCNCRKPATGMIDCMADKYNIDLKSSYIVGDSSVDIQTGVNTGLKTILVRTGVAGKDGRFAAIPDYEAENLMEAVKLIIRDQEL